MLTDTPLVYIQFLPPQPTPLKPAKGCQKEKENAQILLTKHKNLYVSGATIPLFLSYILSIEETLTPPPLKYTVHV